MRNIGGTGSRARRRSPRYYVLAAAVAVGLVGCGRSPESPPVVTAAPGPAPTGSVAVSTSPASVPLPLDDGGPTDAGAAGAPGPRSVGEARARAEAFLRAFARTDLSQQQWWAGVSGYFTPAAAPVYALVDVAQIPVHQIVENSAAVRAGTTRYRALVSVRTDAGTYTVTLLRGGEAWLVDRVTPPSPQP